MSIILQFKKINYLSKKFCHQNNKLESIRTERNSKKQFKNQYQSGIKSFNLTTANLTNNISKYFLKLYLFVCLFLTALGLYCCVLAFSSCHEQRLLFVAERRFLFEVAFLVGEHRLQGARASLVAARGLSSCSSWALVHRIHSCGEQALLPSGMWDLPGPEIKPTSPALADF